MSNQFSFPAKLQKHSIVIESENTDLKSLYFLKASSVAYFKKNIHSPITYT